MRISPWRLEAELFVRVDLRGKYKKEWNHPTTQLYQLFLHNFLDLIIPRIKNRALLQLTLYFIALLVMWQKLWGFFSVLYLSGGMSLDVCYGHFIPFPFSIYMIFMAILFHVLYHRETLFYRLVHFLIWAKRRALMQHS